MLTAAPGPKAVRDPMKGSWDVIIVGSGFGGVFAALPLVEAGARVLMLERGPWVTRGPHNWDPEGTLEKTPYYNHDHHYAVLEGGEGPWVGMASCVGGASVFYGGVSFRLRTADFEPDPATLAVSGARWPFGYDELEPWYDRAEELLHVTGEAGTDPTEPPRRKPYPEPPGPLGETSEMIARAGRSLGLTPFRLPLAINYRAGERACRLCSTCDTFACSVSAKNDLATTLIPGLQRQGLDLRCETIATRVVVEGERVAGIDVVDKRSGARETLRAPLVVLGAGALATPHLLLASGLEARNPAAHTVGRYLTRHCNGIVLGIFPRVPDQGRRFHKQIGFNDFYDGAPGGPAGKLGSIQQLQTPPIALVEENSPRLLRPFMKLGLPHTTGLLVMAEDQAQIENGVWLDTSRTDAFGLPGLQVRQRYSPRDIQGRQALYAQARRILRRAGALFFYHHDIKTFSHAAGTVRFGEDPGMAPLDPDCRFRGVANLFVTDASFMPSCGGVNPSLTIAANALRVGTALARNTGGR